jgi:aspartate aminotransferase-like enzyme/N-acyl-L-homoserine lactone synthetase
LVFKEASARDEIAQLHRLNYQTFAEELKQYDRNETGILIDRFHAGNRYFVAVDGQRVRGMISINTNQPFSIEKRLPHDMELHRKFPSPCEVRLLAIEPGFRNSMILAGLFWQVYSTARREGRSHMLISGVANRSEMYRALGFRELGPAVSAGEASYVPMAMDLEDAEVREKSKRFASWWDRRRTNDDVMLLPGPVQISPTVRDAFARPPMSHRENELIDIYQTVRERLSALAGGMQTALFTGSGTLANDIVAACLRARFGDQHGIVLANGEFGERLIRQAGNAGLKFAPLTWKWGEPWDHARIEEGLKRGAAWVWAVHLETSTGQLNDMRRLTAQARDAGAEVAADCVSSLGAIALDRLGLQFASGVSGKALGSYAGLAFVFVDDSVLEQISFERMPEYFNIREACRQREPLFTLPSPQLVGLAEALAMYYANADDATRRFRHYEDLGAWTRAELRARGCTLVTAEEFAAPTICTFPLPKQGVERCRRSGFRVAHESCYLRVRGWGQVSVMGDLDAQRIWPVFDALCGSEFV